MTRDQLLAAVADYDRQIAELAWSQKWCEDHAAELAVDIAELRAQRGSVWEQIYVARRRRNKSVKVKRP